MRRGALLAEVVAAAALLSVVLAMVVPVLTGVAAVRDDARQRQLAQLQLSNLMEELALRRAAGEPLATAAGELSLPPSVTAALRDGRLEVAIAAVSDQPGCVQVTARLHWTSDAGEPATPAELHLYCFDLEEAP